MYYGLFILIAFAAATGFVLNQKKFGKTPSGLRLEKIKKSPNYSNASFQNQSVTPVMTENVGFLALSKEFFFAKKQRVTPLDPIPSVKTDLKNLDINENVLIWFGHSSYFIQIDGRRILVDPVLSGHASPFSFSIKAFRGSDVYVPEDIILVPVEGRLIVQVLVNLLDNAYKHAGEDAQIYLKVYSQDDTAIFEISDNGVGIDPLIIDKIFDGFVTLYKNNIVDSNLGVGLGLTICKEIVTAHKGTITAKNSKTGGAVFKVVLPLEVV